VLVSQVSVKLYAVAGAAPDDEQLIPIFHRWIRDHAQHLCGKLLIDVADYRHVKDGPGVVLIGHQAHWAVGHLAGGLGLHYSRKKDEPGELAPKLTEAFHDTLTVATMLEAEPALRLKLDTARARVMVMSRLHAANDDAGVAAARPELEAFAARLWNAGATIVHGNPDPRAPLTLDLAAPSAPTMPALLARLAS
jgi:hypothetical protein